MTFLDNENGHIDIIKLFISTLQDNLFYISKYYKIINKNFIYDFILPTSFITLEQDGSVKIEL